ncbi:MAG: formate/nitrite transporter family protein [Armatimonadota bacterium]|nr:formate/nitrite transporter family protein [Armatimonadota bacterium]MDR7443745.1 formate/nitrite transporter family protein [Armatimonadota bacterium]MDR7571271.1 formate/nitrite transporter family protein [Armatimonadota bacterium]MDR7613728.1 formate/nitrite transporter family protein [Armatimonadota bacterium]
MTYVMPDRVVQNMVQAGATKARLRVWDLLIRGFLSGALLGFATTLALTAQLQTRIPLAGALVFPVGFVMIVLLGLELVTGNFALVPLAVLERRAGFPDLLRNWGWVFLGNLLGGMAYAALFVATVAPGSEMARMLATVAEAKTLGYARLGFVGLRMAFTKAVLCNWMVTLGVVLSFTSQSTGGKIAAMWLPIMTFFGQGFEHSVVNMFVIPAGILTGAPVSVGEWWGWNQIPVTLGNVVGGMLFTGLALYATHGRTPGEVSPPVPEPVLREAEG